MTVTCFAREINMELDEDYDKDLDQYEYDANLYQNCDCSNCMECLGLSWRDFM